MTADEIVAAVDAVKKNRDACDALARAFNSTSTMPTTLTVGGKIFSLDPIEIDAVYKALYGFNEKRANDALKWLNDRGITV